jgi:hypothetical protein
MSVKYRLRASRRRENGTTEPLVWPDFDHLVDARVMRDRMKVKEPELTNWGIFKVEISTTVTFKE